jgi:hypothetical protein
LPVRDVHGKQFDDFYTFMEGDARNGICATNMFYFLAAVKGLEVPDRVVLRLDH